MWVPHDGTTIAAIVVAVPNAPAAATVAGLSRACEGLETIWQYLVSLQVRGAPREGQGITGARRTAEYPHPPIPLEHQLKQF